MSERSPLRQRLGVWRTRDLTSAGLNHAAIGRLVSAGAIIRAGHGWYATPGTPAAVTSALSQNQRLTCASAAAIHGLWVPPGLGVHTAGRREGSVNAKSLSALHRPFLREWPDSDPVLPLRLSLTHAINCLEPEHAAVLLESALERRLLDSNDIEDLLDGVSDRRQRLIGHVSATAGSGSETRVRRYLERKHVRVRAQVSVVDVGRVDLLVGDRLIIECDSRAHHAAADSYQKDRNRDAMSLRGGYLVLRLTWEWIWLRWPATQALLDDLIQRKVHRGPRF